MDSHLDNTYTNPVVTPIAANSSVIRADDGTYFPKMTEKTGKV